MIRPNRRQLLECGAEYYESTGLESNAHNGFERRLQSRTLQSGALQRTPNQIVLIEFMVPMLVLLNIKALRDHSLIPVADEITRWKVRLIIQISTSLHRLLLVFFRGPYGSAASWLCGFVALWLCGSISIQKTRLQVLNRAIQNGDSQFE